ncbi:ENTH/VHS/GAT family protein [Wolffia australiana]
MAAELVNSATNKKLNEIDWTKNIEICELISQDNGRAKEVIKSIKKRLAHKNPNVQLFSVMLLETLVNNCGDHVHKQVIESGILSILVKIVKKKTDFPVRERIFLLLDAVQTSLGGASGKFPEYYTAYYDLVSARVQFPQRRVTKEEKEAITDQKPELATGAKDLLNQNSAVPKEENEVKRSTMPAKPDCSIIQKAESVLEVLQEVLNTLDPKNPEGARDEFTLDLVEQCSFQKQRVMHLVMTSRDEKLVLRAIDLNEHLQKVLTKHDAFIMGGSASALSSSCHGLTGDEEEDANYLLRRLRKGKACADDEPETFRGCLIGAVNGGRQCGPISRPLCIESPPSNASSPAAPIPPPPSKYAERIKYFKEKKLVGEGQSQSSRSLCSSSNGSSGSCGGSMDFTEHVSNGNRP